MAEGISFRIFAEKAQADLARLERDVDRATKAALREVSKRFRAEAMKRAPVYQGADAVKRSTKRKPTSSGDISGPPVTGLLRASIKSTSIRSQGRGVYSLKAGPRGLRVHLYAPKIERKYGFIQAAYDAIEPQMQTVHEQAWAQAMKKAGR